MNLLAAVFAASVLAGPALAQDTDRWDARITAVAGEVVVHPVGGDEVSGAADMPLEEGDRITTSAGSTAEISLDGGSLITLGANSDFVLENTRRSASMFSLSLGSLLAKIEKLGTRSLAVHSPTAVAAVRGTEFGVEVDGEKSHVGVFDEGRVEVQSQAGGAEVLTPNQETSVARGQAPLKRFAARRALMRAHVRRLAAVRRNWKAMPPAQRREARAKALKRLRRRRLQTRERQGETPRNRERRRERPRRQPRRRPAPTRPRRNP